MNTRQTAAALAIAVVVGATVAGLYLTLTLQQRVHDLTARLARAEQQVAALEARDVAAADEPAFAGRQAGGSSFNEFESSLAELDAALENDRLLQRVNELDGAVSDLQDLVGWRGDYTRGLWARTEQLRRCMSWLVDPRPSDYEIPPNDCRSLGVGM